MARRVLFLAALIHAASGARSSAPRGLTSGDGADTNFDASFGMFTPIGPTWFRRTATTPSGAGGATGPNSDHTTGIGAYAYAEAGGNVNVRVALNLDVGRPLLGSGVEFYYYMCGSGIGEVTLESSNDGATYETAWAKSGPQQASQLDDWGLAAVQFNATGPHPRYLRFVSKAAGNLGDAAIDDFRVLPAPSAAPTLPPTDAPTRTPSLEPTFSRPPTPHPTPSPLPTLGPSQPSQAPTPQPTRSFHPSLRPTSLPLAAPTPLPTPRATEPSEPVLTKSQAAALAIIGGFVVSRQH